MPAKHLLLTLLCLATTHAEMITVETDPMYILPEANYSFSFDVPDSHTLLSRLYVVSLTTTTNFTCSAAPSVVVLLDTETYADYLPYNTTQSFFIGENMTGENVQAVVTMENCAAFVKVVAEFYHVDDETTIVKSDTMLTLGGVDNYNAIQIPFNATYLTKTTARLLRTVNCVLPIYVAIIVTIHRIQYTTETAVDVGGTVAVDKGILFFMDQFDKDMIFPFWVSTNASPFCAAYLDVELSMHHVDIPATSVPSTAAPWTHIPFTSPFPPPFPPPHVYTPSPPAGTRVDWNFLVVCVVIVVGICVTIMIYLFCQRRRAQSNAHPVVATAVPGLVVDAEVQGVCVDDTLTTGTERSTLLQRG